ncbi:PX domain-containing protein [Heracleum sosnowskyi]|uniref:PX domain-containing protein n=1 Tax=Heracleum sosnowskyi TaxID=360622 RepID=A0AAD8M313_9APIA|nr:PX domain-containing protein [Heracleum sosnowskyi]
MKNGDCENSSDQIGEFLPWQDQQQFDESFNLSPVSSRYSSCGESEFDRYCSANSAMGTPSMCSSVGPFRDAESEFGSFRSLDGFSLGGSFERKFDDRKVPELSRRIGSSDARNGLGLGQGLARNDGAVNLDDDSTGFMDFGVQSRAGEIPDLSTALDEGLYGEDGGGRVFKWDCAAPGLMRSSDSDCMLQKENAEADQETVSTNGGAILNGDSHCSTSVDRVDSCLENAGIDMGCDMINGGRCSDEGEASSRYEYSEGEDSSFGYGTGDEKQIDSYDNRNIGYPQDKIRKNENALRMNSSVAFGSDDWDDYMHETCANPLTSKAPDDLWVQKQITGGSDSDNLHSAFALSNRLQTTCLPVQQVGVKDILTNGNQVEDGNELMLDIGTCSTDSLSKVGEGGGHNMCSENHKSVGLSQPADLPQNCSERNIYVKEHALLVEDLALKAGLCIGEDKLKGVHLCTSTEEKISVVHSSKSMNYEEREQHSDSPSIDTFSHLHSTPVESSEITVKESFEDQISNSLQAQNIVSRTMKESSAPNHAAPLEVGGHKINEYYDEIVHEMEDILLDSNESHGSRFVQSNRSSQSQISMPLRDGGSTASTSSSENVYALMNRPLRIDKVDVVGARQKNGNVSLSERLVGVKEYTVYKLRVWSGEDTWEVERRYRDFCTLYRRLKTLFADQGWILPSPWSSVDRESRKIFGNASPSVIAERSVLIKDCLQSLINSQFSSSHSGPLYWFLSPPKDDPCFPATGSEMLQSTLRTGDGVEKLSTFGTTISLVVKIWPNKSKKQILEAQHYTCLGCHKHFDDGKTRIRDLVQTLGWGKPRLCEYSGQLFCASCHTNETAVLPARVLHSWDFTPYPVSQMAKYYLDSIHDQPMLCVSAVNPLLFSKVPALQLVTNVRKRIGAMLPYVRCPFRRTIFIGLGSRRYLLESNDFFALRDLIDLSRGVFAALPVMVENVSKKILEHITEQCLVCCDVGVPCNARQACEDPSSLFFPFQEGEVERCRSCKVVFHKPCFKKIATCPCGAHIKLDETKRLESKDNTGGDAYGTLDLLRRQDDSWSSANFLSGLFSKAKLEKLLVHKDHDNVISMGSLPSSSM